MISKNKPTAAVDVKKKYISRKPKCERRKVKGSRATFQLVEFF